MRRHHLQRGGAVKTEKTRCCLNCIYFNNSPRYIESVFAGLTVLGSGYSSVKRDDGICQLDGRFLSGYNLCKSYREKSKD